MTRDLSRWTPAPAPVASTASCSDGPDERRGPRVAAAVLLLAGPVELLVCEAVAASAWTDPPYSYVRNVLSDLAVPARHTFFQGRPIESPLHALMNASFGVFGPLVLVAAVIVTSPLPGRIRRPVRSLALASTLANLLVSLVPETTVAPLHGTGAFLSFLCGNALVVVLAVQTRALGLPAGVRVTLLTLGCIGLAALLVLVTIPALYSGALERFIAYPYLAALLVLGTSILPRRRHASRDRGTGRAGHRPRGCTATSAALTANHSRSPGSASSSATADGVTSADRPSAPPRRPGPSCAEGLRTDDGSLVAGTHPGPGRPSGAAPRSSPGRVRRDKRTQLPAQRAGRRAAGVASDPRATTTSPLDAEPVPGRQVGQVQVLDEAGRTGLAEGVQHLHPESPSGLLELLAVKAARAVLRGPRRSNAPGLPD